MPHRCMECKSVLESGEMDLKAGCPVCGNKKFEYVRPPKKERREADVRKLTVAEYVARAEAEETKHEEKTRRKDAPKAPKPAVEPKPPEQKPPEPKPVEQKPAPKDKKPAHEQRIESVRIVEKGSYDLNLPMLLNRKELVMSKEDGVYVVDLPSALKATPKKKKR